MKVLSRRWLFCCLIIAVSSVYAPAAFGDELAYRLEGHGDVITFTLSSTPLIGANISGFGFEIDGVGIQVNGQPETADVVFTHDSDGPTLTIGQGASLLPPRGVYGGYPTYAFLTGSVLYSNGESDPTLAIGDFNLQEYDVNTPVDYGLSVSSVAGVQPTPEPSTFALLGTGLFGVVGLVRRRFV